MKRAILFAALVTTFVWVPTAHAQFFGQLGTLEPTAKSGMESFGAFAGLARHELGATGMVRFVPSNPTWDLGVQASFGKIDNGGPTAIGVAADAKLALFKPGPKGLDIGGDVGVAFSHWTDNSVLTVLAIPEVSYRVPVGGGKQELLLWGGIGVGMAHTSTTVTTYLGSSSGSDTRTSARLRLGVGYTITPSLTLVGEHNYDLSSLGAGYVMLGLQVGMSK